MNICPAYKPHPWFNPKWIFWRFLVSPNDILDIKKIMLVLVHHGKDRMFSRDRASISNPKLNICFPSLTDNSATTDCMEITLGPSIQHIPLGFYHTGGFNAIWNISFLWRRYKDSARHRLWKFHVINLQCVSCIHVRAKCGHLLGKSFFLYFGQVLCLQQGWFRKLEKVCILFIVYPIIVLHVKHKLWSQSLLTNVNYKQDVVQQNMINSKTFGISLAQKTKIASMISVKVHYQYQTHTQRIESQLKVFYANVLAHINV